MPVAPTPERLRPPRARAYASGACALWLCLCTLALLLTRAAHAEAPRRLPIVFHIAQQEGQPVAPASFIAEQLAAANSIYVPLGIELVAREMLPLGAEHAEMNTRADRDALARYVRKGAIHCFIVAKLMDVDEAGRERRGVHWHPRPAPRNSFLIVSRISKPYVLAHELGHMFGNPQHSTVPGNLMSYTRTEAPPFLDAEQIRRVRRTVAALLKEGAIVALAREAAPAPKETPRAEP
ncbi:MAG TPA: hypothetical protein VMG12_14785 [Polyangiaceae bacterium]|nr:hypothetical protein [Polyangiaceae bacterium]